MHRTLKEETTKPPARTFTEQQKKFDRFGLIFNHERPHEALQNETPGSVCVPSARMLHRNAWSFTYPKSYHTRRVNNSGDSWHKGRVFISEVFRNGEIGFEQIDENVYRVCFCNTELGEFNS
jgi:Integrase core domain